MPADTRIFIPDEDKLFRSVRPDDWDFEKSRPRTAVLISQEISVDWSVNYDPLPDNDAHAIIYPKSDRFGKTVKDRSQVAILEPARQIGM